MTDAMLSDVEIYQSADGSFALDVRTDRDTVWVSRQQMADLFGRDVKTIGKHIGNARQEELAGAAVVAKFATTASDGKTYQVEHYDLDVVLAVGYRVKSAEGIHFRRWANDVLKRYVLAGVARNEHRLEQLGSIVRILSRSSDELVAGVADVLAGYLPSLTLLRDYDAGRLDAGPGTVAGWELTIEETRAVISEVRVEFPEDILFGGDRGGALEGELPFSTRDRNDTKVTACRVVDRIAFAMSRRSLEAGASDRSARD
jgi:hypothetical protein